MNEPPKGQPTAAPMGDAAGVFLGLVALVLLFALLRAQKRNRQLLEEMLEAAADAD